MIFQSSNLLLLYEFNRFIPALYGQLFFFWSKLPRFPYKGAVSFFKHLVQVLTVYCFFTDLFRVTSPDNLPPYQGNLFHLSDFLRPVVWRC